ncbi:hypothetical protein [Paenibacillus amylolyticus]|uniref:Uncharacterized protein n=1 Tax=Paenibacillus amylolyticus TaxID=1451 RepID=A0A100VM22_PAEAM|nr:hypothetical protein [Paenibacillus amylolyticus]GAS82360.1 unknown protein [Paenibacillus amylolyticus]
MLEAKDEQRLLLLNEIIKIRERMIKEKKRDEKLLKKCEEIERYLNNSRLSKDEIVKYKYKIIVLEKEIDEYETSIKKRFIWMIAIIGAFTTVLNHVISGGVLKLDSPGWEEFFTKYFGMFLFMLIGIIGAMTKLLLDEYKTGKDRTDQMLLGFLFPVVFVNLFSYNEGQIQGVIIVNLLIFVCGFSVEFILLFLNRLIDIAKKTFNLEEKEDPSRTLESSENNVSAENK